jgi:membrane protein
MLLHRPFKIGIPLPLFLRQLVQESLEHNILDGAAVLGFFLMLAIFPAIIFLMAVIPYLPIAQVDVAIMDFLAQVMPAGAAQMLSGAVREVTQNQSGGLLSLGLLGAAWAASSGMHTIIAQINRSYEVTESRNWVRVRLAALLLSAMFAVTVLGGFSLIVLGGVIQDRLAEYVGASGALLAFFAGFRWVVIAAVLLLGYALIYYYGPDAKQDFVFVTLGSVLGVALLVGASLVFAWYVQNFGDYAATYGSVGAAILLLLWLYIAGLTILFGAEVNALVEHHSPEGKEKGENVEGQKEHDPGAVQANKAAARGGDRHKA